MRVAIVGTELCAVDSRGGGLEQVVRRWAAALSADHDVVVVSHRRPVPSLDDPYETVAVARPADLAGALAGIRPDVVSLHNRPQWAPLCDAPAGVTFHNYPPAWKVPARWTPAPGLAASAVSAALSAAAGALFGAAVTVVPPSIDPVFLEPVERRPGRTVLSPNRLMRKKGVLDLLAVAPRLPDVTFELTDLISPWLRPTAEHRELRAAVRAVANARLVPPPAGASGVAELMAGAGVVACPVTEPEGLGLVALEAQAVGVPLVTTDQGGLREATFPPNRCIRPGDPDALAAALAAALTDAPPGSARAAVAERHSPAASARAFGAWLTSVASR